MTGRRIKVPIIWTMVICVLLGGAYLVVSRNGSAASSGAAVGYFH